MKNPKLSVVLTGRNDDYDGNFNERLLIATRRNLKALPQAEFVFVEWNPIPSKKLVSQLLREEFGDRVQCFVVDKSFRALGGKQEFAEFPAKNVGIRRARGEFILVTNSDIVFSPEVVKALNGRLSRKICYRALRIDIPGNYFDVRFPIRRNRVLGINDVSPTDAAGDFMLLHRDIWFEATGFCEGFPDQRIHKDALMVEAILNQFALPIKVLGTISHWRHPSSHAANPKKNFIGDINWDYRWFAFRRNDRNWGLNNQTERTRAGIRWIVQKNA